MYHEDTGMACGPVSMTTIDAEIVVEKDDGKKIYLHGQWVDQAGDEDRADHNRPDRAEPVQRAVRQPQMRRVYARRGSGDEQEQPQ